MIRDDLRTAPPSRRSRTPGCPNRPSGIVLDPPKQRDHGDWATPVALAAGQDRRRRTRSRSPSEIGDALDAARGAAPGPGRGRAARASSTSSSRRPGCTTCCATVVAAGERLRHAPTCSPGGAINLEFVSANPTGPLHAGGGRWVAVGDAIANLLAAQGAEVHREYYLNDAGNQLDTFRDSLLRALPRRGSRPRTGTRASTSSTWPRELRAELGDDVDARRRVRVGLPRRSSTGCRTTSARIGVHFDTWFSERTLHERGDVADVLARARRARRRLRARRRDAGCAPPTSATRATACSCAADGTTTYLCNDLAYHRDKFARGFTHLIDIWGADHHGQVKSLQAGHGGARLPRRRARDHARPVREARAGRARGPHLEARPATSSRSPTSSTRSIPTSRA